MSVIIIKSKTSEGFYHVNNKTVLVDDKKYFVAQPELTHTESRVFKAYLNALT